MIRSVVGGICLLALCILVIGCLINVVSDGGDIAEPRTWVYGYWGVFGQLGFTDKELGSLGPFAILALLCSTCVVWRPESTCSTKS